MATINLSKGGNISLSKSSANLTRALVGCGWDPRTTDGKPFDVDASAIVCGADGKALSDADFIFYGNLQNPSGSVQHQGDNLTGEGDGDDEQIIIDLSKLPAGAEKVSIVVSIYDAESRGQTFGQISNAYIRVTDADNEAGSDDLRFDLQEDASTNRSMIFADLYLKNGEWKMRAVEQGYDEGLGGVLKDFGLIAS